VEIMEMDDEELYVLNDVGGGKSQEIPNVASE
jgi:hypothetical protein